MRPQRRRRLAAGVMFATGAVIVMAPALASAEDPRTDTDLIGYDNEGRAAPVTVRFFEDFIPLPVDPGEPQFEITLAHSGATLTTGPLSRGVASTVWPGAGIGDGWGTVVCSSGGEDCDDRQTFPLRAAAEYPGAGPDSWSEDTHGIMSASAVGLEAVGRASAEQAGSAADGIIQTGPVTSESRVTEVDGTTITTSVSSISEIAIAGGAVTIDAVVTRMEARSDGETAVTSGETTVSGISVLGQPVRVTDNGLVIEAAEGAGPLGDGLGDLTGPLGETLLDPVNDVVSAVLDGIRGLSPEQAIGVGFDFPDQEEVIDGGIAERRADGVTIVLDMTALNGILIPILEAANYQDLLALIPDDPDNPDDAGVLKGYLIELANFAPRTEIVLGKGFVAASAVPPFVFEPPPLPDPPPPLPPPLSASPTSTPTPVPSTGVAGVPTTTTITTPPSTPQVQPPQVATPDTTVVGSPVVPIERFGGVSLVYLGLGLMLAAVPTWGMRTLRESAVGPDSSVAIDGQLPDLREVI